MRQVRCTKGTNFRVCFDVVSSEGDACNLPYQRNEYSLFIEREVVVKMPTNTHPACDIEAISRWFHDPLTISSRWLTRVEQSHRKPKIVDARIEFSRQSMRLRLGFRAAFRGCVLCKLFGYWEKNQ